MSVYRTIVKPCFDITIAFFALCVSSPFLLLSIFGLYIANNGSVWFLQDRPGFNGNKFKVIKFKTMNDGRGANGELLPDEIRLTKMGKLMRATSMDELPQLINVIKGEMSIVGPRPLLMEYLPLYNEHQRKRHNVKPGITGWAQVNGRNAISWEQKFAYDVWYVENQSFLLDLKIVFLTVVKVFKSEGINSKTSVTMEKFRGNKA